MRVPIENIVYSDSTYAEKPRNDHGGEEESDPVCSIMLKGKQGYQYDTSNGYFYICKIIAFYIKIIRITEGYKKLKPAQTERTWSIMMTRN